MTVTPISTKLPEQEIHHGTLAHIDAALVRCRQLIAKHGSTWADGIRPIIREELEELVECLKARERGEYPKGAER